MTGKLLIKDLKSYLEPLLDVPVYLFDNNIKRELPCVIIGIESEEQHEVLDANYTVNGFIMIGVNGYEDEENETTDALTESITALLCLDTCFESIEVEALYLTGNERKDEEDSTFVFIGFEAFI